MQIINAGSKMSLASLKAMSELMFGQLVKAVVDVGQEAMAVDAELHADEEAALLSQGSKQESLWGINLYPSIDGEDWIEFDSMINLRPAHNNRSRGVEDAATRQKIIAIVNKLIER